MTHIQAAQMIASMGLPYSYYQFEEGTDQATPFICYFYPTRNDMIADDSNYAKVEHLVVELYTDKKDFDEERKVEDVLTAYGLVYTKDEAILDSEQMYEVVYETEFTLTEE